MNSTVKMISKPHLSVAAHRLLCNIAAYARRFSGSILHNAASDVMDGHYYRSDPEVRELTRKRIVDSTPDYSWVLTDYGCDLLRATALAGEGREEEG